MPPGCKSPIIPHRFYARRCRNLFTQFTSVMPAEPVHPSSCYAVVKNKAVETAIFPEPPILDSTGWDGTGVNFRKDKLHRHLESIRRRMPVTGKENRSESREVKNYKAVKWMPVCVVKTVAVDRRERCLSENLAHLLLSSINQ